MIYNPPRSIFFFSSPSIWKGGKLHGYSVEQESISSAMKTVAIVEDEKSGCVFTVPIENIKFGISQ